MKSISEPKLVGVARLNEKSQLVIPKEAREFLGIGPGDHVLIVLAPFFKGIVIARPEDMEEHLKEMISNSQKTIGTMQKKMKK